MNQTDIRYEQGKALLQEGRFTEAAVIFEQLTAEMPKYKKAWEKLAFSFLGQNLLEEAIQCYDEILVRYPKDAAAFYQKAVLEDQAGRHDKALESLDKALKIEPKNAEFLYSNGYVHFRMKKYNEAIFWFDRALAIDPFLFAAADYKCVCLTALGVYDEVIYASLEFIERFKCFIQEDSDDLKKEKQIQNSDSNPKDDDDGSELFGKETISLQKEDIHRLYGYLSFAYMKIGAFKQAEDILYQEISFASDESQIYYYLGLVQTALGKYDEAISSYEKVLKLDPSFTAAQINLGLTLEKAAGKKTEATESLELYERSLSVLEHVFESEPENSSVLYKIGQISLALGLKDKALCAFNDVLHLDASFVPVFEDLAKIKFNDGDYDGALSILNEAQVKDPFNYEVMNLIGVIYSIKGENEAALKYLNRAATLDATNAKALYNKALIHIKTEDYEKAIECLSCIYKQNALDAGLSYSKVLLFLGESFQNLGCYDDALSIFEQLQKYDPEDTSVLEIIAELKLQKHDSEDTSVLETAAELNLQEHDSKDTSVLETAAELNLRQHDSEDTSVLETAAELKDEIEK
ncbi:MAG: tetratricopeptide repeat protein [Methanimicrococcus sp.]|nr:tetratricopeptide repeat protein [Methanimicrococcus sp.]